MILNALIGAVFFAGFVAVLAIPWMTVPTYAKRPHGGHDAADH